MPDLQERLQSVLGATYLIERELGGGMSRVFVAEDVRLGRKVVLKVLPTELAAGVNVERFEREIRLAARLQHPHIVPLLAAGSAGDLPYYVMPYIEGESLRARLAREGELPLGDAVRLLREVLDALEYAHEHAVVHRDIKPENVLLTGRGRHAVVTDFGVAKALSEATGDARLTATGMALGTPAYMAPEQIAGEANVDHRVDIYAVGALAFEMISGMQPFRGATTQAILAAHMTQSPPSLRSLRQAIPPALDAVILRCLEKRPADRWQTAGEIVRELDAIAGLPTPTPTAASVGSVPNAWLALHPLSIAAFFGVASLAVLALVWGLVRGLGLPDWVFQGAVALLVAGLPIMLLTSQRERERAAGQRATPVGIARLFTWRRSLQGGVLAFAALGLASAGFMASRALGVGPGATLVSSGILTTRDRILIADFENRTADSTLSLTMTQLLRIDLAQSPSISVMEPAQVAEVLGRMQRPATTSVTAEVAHEVATREGLKAYLIGEVLPAGSGFAIAVRLLNTATGDALISLRQTATSPDKLIAAVDKLSGKLREEIGESLRSVRADRPLEQVTTSSLDALHLYAEATRVGDAGAYDRAIQLMERAIAQDSTFAMAWRRLGMYSANPGMGPLLRQKGDSALRRAYALRDRLPEREGLFVEAAIATVVEPDFERALAAYLSILEKYPNDETALNNAGASYARLGRLSEAQEMYRRAIATARAGALTYENGVRGATFLGKLNLGDSILNQFQRAYPHSGDFARAASLLASARQDFQAVDSIANSMLRGPPLTRAEGHQMLAMTAELAGRFHDAGRQTRDALRANLERGALAAAEVEVLADFAEIARTADYATDQRPLLRRLTALWEENRELTAKRPGFDRRYQQFAPVFAQLGDTTRARQLAAEFSRLMESSPYPATGARVNADARLASILIITGHPDEALGKLRETCQRWGAEYLICARMAFLAVAEAHDRAGRTDSAIAAYRRFVELKGARNIAPPRAVDDVTPKIAPAWRRLGELLDSKGDRKGAIEAYERFLDFWRNADPELQPIVRNVRERANRLRRATG